jgi:1,4-alpha-glucan branching enzyme
LGESPNRVFFFHKSQKHQRGKEKIMINRAYPKSNNDNRRHTFAFTAPEARNVQLVGDFTHWTDQPIKLHKGRNGTWQTTVDLPKGVYHYRFLVDGEWRDDPESVLRVSNPFGTQDSVAQVD